MNYIEELQNAIRELYGSEATHVETVPVKEEFQGDTIWEGEVEVFDLANHEKTDRVYAWAQTLDDGEKRVVTVLHIPPATSPLTAVRVSIVNEYGNR